MQITENFTMEELTSSATARVRNISNQPGEKEATKLRELCEKILQPIRSRYGKPIRITSGYRNRALNNAVGGAASSQHLLGEAADIVCDNNNLLWEIICSMVRNDELTVGQLIDEKHLKWIHISLPDGRHHNQILHL